MKKGQRMAHAIWAGLAVMILGASVALPEGGVVLREEAGGTARVLIELRAEGEYRPEPPPGTPKPTTPSKPQPLKIESRLDFIERVAQTAPDGSARKTARRVVEAATAIAGEGGRLLKLRPELALLVGERRDTGVVVFSAGGPLSRWELEMVQVPGDPLGITGLLPDREVKVGDKWPVSAFTAKNLSDYDTIVSNGLEAKLDSLTDDLAEVRVGGTVKGSARGGDGEIRFTGKYTFDRKAKRISKLELDRDETRKQGLVEWGLSVKSRLLVERTACEAPKELSDDAVTALAKEGDPRREWLVLESPDGRYVLEHDREWHLTLETPRQIVLKRIDKADLVAQCNLAVGPNAGKGKHQDLNEFRADLKKALGTRFVQIVSESEKDTGPTGGFRYKATVLGREGTLDVIWYYYLLASPNGDQLLATFTLDAASETKFLSEDEALIGALEWKATGR